MEKKTPGKVGIKDVSQEAGVALSTVSHVLNGTAPISAEVRARVLDAARRLGYLAKRQQKGAIASLSTLYLAVPNANLPHVNTNLFSWTMLSGLTRECERRAIKLVPHASEGDLSAPEIIAGARACGADGIILVHDHTPRLIKGLAASGIATVLLNGDDPSMSIDTVVPSNRYGARLAAEWLLSRGHQRILHLTWRGRSTIRRRLDGVRDALLARDLSPDACEVLYADGYEPGHGEAALSRFIAARGGLGGNTAIFCAADNLAIGALNALRAAGISVPGEISVIGFDGVTIGELTTPPLATVRVPLDHLAAAAVQTLENRLAVHAPDFPPVRIELACQLIIRESAREASSK